MLFTKETDYAIRIVRALKDGGRKSIKEICQQEHVPESFAYKILKKLDKGGIVESFRGVGGGSQLKKPADRLTLYDIILVMEPDFAVMHCIREGCENNTKSSYCKMHRQLLEIQSSLEAMLKAKTIKQILE